MHEALGVGLGGVPAGAAVSRHAREVGVVACVRGARRWGAWHRSFAGEGGGVGYVHVLNGRAHGLDDYLMTRRPRLTIDGIWKVILEKKKIKC